MAHESHHVCHGAESHLQFLGLVSAERLQGEAEVVGLRKRAQVEVILGVDAGRHVDVELQQLQKLALQLVPVGKTNGQKVHSPNQDFLLSITFIRLSDIF